MHYHIKTYNTWLQQFTLYSSTQLHSVSCVRQYRFRNLPLAIQHPFTISFLPAVSIKQKIVRFHTYKATSCLTQIKILTVLTHSMMVRRRWRRQINIPPRTGKIFLLILDRHLSDKGLTVAMKYRRNPFGRMLHDENISSRMIKIDFISCTTKLLQLKIKSTSKAPLSFAFIIFADVLQTSPQKPRNDSLSSGSAYKYSDIYIHFGLPNEIFQQSP